MRLSATIIAVGFLLPASTLASSADSAPDWSLQSADGPVIQLNEEVRERPAILLFWASWCPYCKALMPHLQSIRLEYGEDINILAINFREDGDPVAFIRNAGYDFTVLPDGDEVAAAYGVYGTPGVIIVDSAQKIRFDLRTLPKKDPPTKGNSASHRKKAAYRAPYWAAEIRMAIDSVLESPAQ